MRALGSDYSLYITSQYQSSTRLLAWMKSLESTIVEVVTVADSIRLAFDIDSAVGPQLDTLGVIIGLPRDIEVSIPNLFFSWYDGHAPTDVLGWGMGSWRSLQEETHEMTKLPDDAYRQVLKFKILQNSWNGTADGLYRAWEEVFVPDNITLRVQDNQDMSVSFFVTGQLIPATVQYILLGNYIPLKPAGVQVTFIFSSGSP
jgi:hypothetical protein